MNTELIARLRNDKNMHPDELDALLNAAADALEAMRYFKACPGIARKGCQYTATCDQVCKKCGEVHHSHQLPTALEAAQPAPQVRIPLAKNQPCGCVICTCEDDERCNCCGAKHCGNHPVGVFASPVYAAPQVPEFQIALTRELADVKQDLLSTQNQLWTANRIMGNAVKQMEEWEAKTKVPMTDAQSRLMLDKLGAQHEGDEPNVWDRAIVVAVEAHHKIGVKP